MSKQSTIKKTDKLLDGIRDTVNDITTNVNHTYEMMKSVTSLGPTGNNVYIARPEVKNAMRRLEDIRTYVKDDLDDAAREEYNRQKERLLSPMLSVDLNAVGDNLAVMVETAKNNVSAYMEVLDRDRNRLKELDKRVSTKIANRTIRSGSLAERAANNIKKAMTNAVPNAINRSDVNHEIDVAAMDINNNLAKTHHMDFEGDIAKAKAAAMLYADIEQLYTKIKAAQPAEHGYLINQFLAGTNLTPSHQMLVSDAQADYIRKYYLDMQSQEKVQEYLDNNADEALEIQKIFSRIDKTKQCTVEQYEMLVRHIYKLWIPSNAALSQYEKAELTDDLEKAKNLLDLEGLSRKALAKWVFASKPILEGTNALSPEDWAFLDKYKDVNDIFDFWGRSSRWKKIQDDLEKYYEAQLAVARTNRLIDLAKGKGGPLPVIGISPGGP